MMADSSGLPSKRPGRLRYSSASLPSPVFRGGGVLKRERAPVRPGTVPEIIDGPVAHAAKQEVAHALQVNRRQDFPQGSEHVLQDVLAGMLVGDIVAPKILAHRRLIQAVDALEGIAVALGARPWRNRDELLLA
jgi:hypothetical protein